MNGSKLGWMAFRGAVGIAASAATGKLLTMGFKAVTGNKPPKHPEHPDVGARQAVTWAIATSVGIAVTELLITRKAANLWRNWTGELPPGFDTD